VSVYLVAYDKIVH